MRICVLGKHRVYQQFPVYFHGGNRVLKGLSAALKQIYLIAQLGISIISPLLLCIFICWLLTAKLDIGGWVFLPGILFGLGGSFMSGYKFYLSETKKSEKNKDKDKVQFNKHM